MLYSDKNIVISDSVTEDREELVNFMSKYGISETHFTQYYNRDIPISEPFINYRHTIYRKEELEDVSYITSRELTEIVSRKNESQKEQGYPITKLLIIYTGK